MTRNETWQDSPLTVLRRMARPLFIMLAMFYLAYHAFSGERGLFALFSETRKLEALKVELADVKAQRTVLERKVRGLSSGTLDLDLLDEQSRRVLGQAGKDEIVYFMDGKKKPEAK